MGKQPPEVIVGDNASSRITDGTGVLVCFFKPTRFACGETRRYYFATLSQSHLAEGLLTRSQFAGQRQTKADNTGPTKPRLHPKFQPRKIKIEHATQLRRFACGDTCHEWA